MRYLGVYVIQNCGVPGFLGVDSLHLAVWEFEFAVFEGSWELGSFATWKVASFGLV